MTPSSADFNLCKLGQIAVKVRELARGLHIEAEPRLAHKAHDHDLCLSFFRDLEVR